MSTPEELPYVDRIDIDEIFVDLVRMTMSDGHVVKTELAVTRPYVTRPEQLSSVIVPVARLVLTPLAAANLYQQLANVIAHLEQTGVLKRTAPAPMSTQ